jgi:hypothetical protein
VHLGKVAHPVGSDPEDRGGAAQVFGDVLPRVTDRDREVQRFVGPGRNSTAPGEERVPKTGGDELGALEVVGCVRQRGGPPAEIAVQDTGVDVLLSVLVGLAK